MGMFRHALEQFSFLSTDNPPALFYYRLVSVCGLSESACFVIDNLNLLNEVCTKLNDVKRSDPPKRLFSLTVNELCFCPQIRQNVRLSDLRTRNPDYCTSRHLLQEPRNALPRPRLALSLIDVQPMTDLHA
ncbi:hypothetical protein EVAR_39429_1 [Eumeta japonica]|uniref:Uncharacterized protein n=1 Tax=Eumeta variegata TaxID=151549 RepID=A0A4C1W1J5_EUMVA|nr:hypothetical protein EVAR_39429_1 [Eumeta japonica]